MSDQPSTNDAAPKKKGRKKLIIIVVALLLLGGGGGGFFFWRHQSAANAAEGDKESKKEKGKKEKDKGKDKKKDKESSESSESKTELPEEDDSEVKEVIELQPFIVNLADKNESRYLRMSVSLGIGESGGGEEAKADPLFTTRVRNAILAIVTTKTTDEILTVEGKTKLRKEMLSAAQSVVEKPEIHAIYITDFIVQM